ncbi:hypothetical protein LZ32DRAFT_600176 [Colletotrichum eremochloae]|nr:hypothetical protein LZ32DRAFT_600176 [Colletotrichum eremochloae]
MATIALSNDITPYTAPSMDQRKERRSTCRHFRAGKCVYWQTPEKCDFPHRPKHAPRIQLSVETGTSTSPLRRRSPPYLEEAPRFVPDYQQHPSRLEVNTFSQEPVIDPNSGNVHHVYDGGDLQYLGCSSNNTDPQGQVDFQPYDHMMLPQPGLHPAEHRTVCADYYPGHGTSYKNPGAPFSYSPESHVISIESSNDRPPPYQQLYQIPYTPPDSSSISPLMDHTTYFEPPVTNGYAAFLSAGVEQNTLVDPEKLKRERSKDCWYGDDCKRPNCYYRHNVVKDEVEGGPSGSSSSTLAPAGSLAADLNSPNTGPRKGKEKWNAKGPQALVRSSGQGSSDEVKTTAEDKPAVEDESSEEKPHDG